MDRSVSIEHWEQVTFHFVDLGMPAQTIEDRHVLAIAEDRQGALWGRR
jgi:hypothetical protein